MGVGGSWWEVFLPCLYFSYFSIFSSVRENLPQRVLAERMPHDHEQVRLTAVCLSHGLTAQGGGGDVLHRAHGVILGKRKQWAGFVVSRVKCPLGPTGNLACLHDSMGCWDQVGTNRNCAFT